MSLALGKLLGELQFVLGIIILKLRAFLVKAITGPDNSKLSNFSVMEKSSQTTRREMVHYRLEGNPFVKILLTQIEYRFESNILLLREKINFLC